MNNTVIGVDLAKDVIQVCVIRGNIQVSNEEMSHSDFNLWLSSHTSQTIVFEACVISNYWKQRAVALGHTAHLISAIDRQSTNRQSLTQTFDIFLHGFQFSFH